jgi:hypothetical protein
MQIKFRFFEKYKQYYPQQKENLFELSKTPIIGFYMMKGYRPEQPIKKNNQNKSKSNEKIFNHLVKKYFNRKRLAENKNSNTLPDIDSPLAKINPQSHIQSELVELNRNKRIRTEYMGLNLRERKGART